MSYVIDTHASVNSPSITACSSGGNDRSTLSQAAQQAYYDAHLERFRSRPRTPAPAGINQPKPEPQLQPE